MNGIKELENFKYSRSKIVTNGSVKEEITIGIKYSEQCCHVMRDRLWKWKCLRKEKYACLKVTECPYGNIYSHGSLISYINICVNSYVWHEPLILHKFCKCIYFCS